MQIHEITHLRLREKALSNIASGFLQGLTGVDFPRQRTTNVTSLGRATQKRARELAQQWEKLIKAQRQSRPTQSKSSTTSSNWRQDALKSAGAAFAQAPTARPAPGQMPASVATSAQGQRMMQAYGQPRGGVQSVKEAPAEYTTSSGIIVPGSPETTVMDFERWADQQLTTQISGTGQKIDLDAVKKDPAVKAQLDKVLPQIKRDPYATAAVEQYFLIAMQAMQKMADTVKQKQILDKQ